MGRLCAGRCVDIANQRKQYDESGIGHRREPGNWSCGRFAAGPAGLCGGVNYLRDESAARQVVAEIEAQGGKALALQADVADEAQVMAMFAALDAGLGTLSALVNNAGILFQQANIEQLTAERINQVLGTNVTGYFLCCREAVKRMALRHGGQGGAIVNVSSAASRLGLPGNTSITPPRKAPSIP